MKPTIVSIEEMLHYLQMGGLCLFSKYDNQVAKKLRVELIGVLAQCNKSDLKNEKNINATNRENLEIIVNNLKWNDGVDTISNLVSE